MSKIFFLLLVSLNSFATNHYWSNAGSNANNGLTTGAPKQTIAQLVIDMSGYAASDSILFKRGDVFYGDVYGIIIKRASLNFDAYGTGANPIISGLTTIGSGTWVSVGTNLYEAPVSNVKSGVNLILRNSLIQQVGRYPNTNNGTLGYLTYTSGTTTTLTGIVNSSVTDWTGAEVVVRPDRWSISHSLISSHSGTGLTFAAIDDAPAPNYGYFFQRDARTLDQDGEWFWNASTGKLRVYSTAAPSTYNYQISTVDSLISNHGSYYGNISIKNIDITGANAVGIEAYSCTNYTIQNCNFSKIGANGVDMNFGYNCIVDNCTFKNILGTGVRMYNNATSPVMLKVSNCNIDSIALLAGMEYGKNFYGSNGIIVKGNNGTVEYNVVKNVGYAGIEWGMGSNIVVQKNFVDNFCIVRDDGGAFYTFQGRGTLPYYSNRTFKNNFALHGMGQNYGTDDLNGTAVTGIYFDEGTHNVDIDSNSVAYIKGTGIFGNSNDSLNIRDNISYSNNNSHGLRRLGNSIPVRTIYMTRNTFYPFRQYYTNLVLDNPSLITEAADIAAYGTLDSNYYSLRSGIDTSISIISTWTNKSNYREYYSAFSYVTGTIGIETHSTNVANTGSYYYNYSSTPSTVNFAGFSYKNVKGTVYNNSVTIPAYYSLMLIPNGAAPGTNNIIYGIWR